MTPARVFWLFSVLAFVVSCVFYRRGHKLNGDRFLFLAYGIMLGGWIALFEGWGLL